MKKKLQKNFGADFTDKIIRLGLSFFIGALIARNLGPENLGILNYAIALVTLAYTFVGIGVGSIVRKEIASEQISYQKILNQGFMVYAISSIVALISINFYNAIAEESPSVRTVIFIYSLIAITKPLDVIYIWFEAKMNLNKILRTQISIYLLFAAIKATWFHVEGTVTVLTAIMVLELTVQNVAIFNKFRILNDGYKLTIKDIRGLQNLVRPGIPYMVSSASIIVYMKSDLIMVKSMLGEVNAGYYAVATKFTEASLFIPMTLAASIAPIIYKVNSDKEKRSKYTQLAMDVMFSVGILHGISISIMNFYMLTIIYGEHYQNALNPALIYSGFIPFVYVGLINSAWFVANGTGEELAIRSIFAAITNIGLNYILIQALGLSGAAISTVISSFIQVYGFDLIRKDNRELFIIRNRSLNILRGFKSIMQVLKLKEES